MPHTPPRAEAKVTVSAHAPGNQDAALAIASAAAAGAMKSHDPHGEYVVVTLHQSASKVSLAASTLQSSPRLKAVQEEKEHDPTQVETFYSINTPLEPFLPQPSFCHRLGSSFYTTLVKPCWEGLSYAATHKTATAFALLSALPNALNAMTSSSNTQPQDIGANWWNALTIWQRFLALTDGLSSLGINAIISVVFIPDAGAKVVDSIKKYCDSKENAVGNSFSLALGVSAALASTAIAYSSFEWLSPTLAGSALGEEAGSKLGTSLAVTAAAINFVIYFATRYVGIKSFSRKFRDTFFNTDRQFQKHVLDQLYRVEKTEQKTLSTLLSHRTLHEEKEIEYFLTDLNRHYKADPTRLIRPKTCGDYAEEYTLLLVDVLITAIAIGGIAITFDQKFVDGLKMIIKQIGNLEGHIQALIGLPGALSSAMLYASSAIDFRATLWTMLCHLKQQPWDTPKAILLLLTNFRACGSMFNIASGVVHNPHKIFSGLSSNSTLSQLYTYDSQIGTGINNGKASIAQSFPVPEPNVDKPELEDVRLWLKKNRLSVNVIARLKNLHLFAPAQPEKKAYQALPSEATPLSASSSRPALG